MRMMVGVFDKPTDKEVKEYEARKQKEKKKGKSTGSCSISLGQNTFWARLERQSEDCTMK